jgi:hypothetical protein
VRVGAWPVLLLLFFLTARPRLPPRFRSHYPEGKFSVVAETPESMRLKKQTERQSITAYHKVLKEGFGCFFTKPPLCVSQAYEEDKGKYTAVADDMHTSAATKQSALLSRATYDQRGAEERHKVTGACWTCGHRVTNNDS